MRKTFASFSFGCRVNQAEMEELNRQLIGFGYSYDQKRPSFYIINTCSVTAKAEREARQHINQIRRKFPKAKIIITGCAATKWIMERKKIPGVELMIDNRKKEGIAFIINSKIKNQNAKTSAKIKDKKDLSFKLGFDLCALNFDPSKYSKYLSCGRMILKIQDGCQRFCSYCIVPYLRGKPKSIPIELIVKRINDLVTPRGGPKRSREDSSLPADATHQALQAGEVDGSEKIKEVILAAINTEAFGFDTGETFNDLIKAVLTETKIERLSFGSIHPWSINNEFIKFYKQIASDQRFIDFFHIPLQSGSNKILNLMKRGYTGEEFMEKLNTINKINPLAFIGTDIIVGFPGETDHDFEDTYNFLAASPISKFHIFRFSKREKTAAYYMAQRLKEPSPQKKIARAKILSELGKRKYQKFLAKHLHKTFPALFLSRDKNSFQWALLTNQIPVIVDTDKELTREIKNVKVKNIKEDKLFGVIS